MTGASSRASRRTAVRPSAPRGGARATSGAPRGRAAGDGAAQEELAASPARAFVGGKPLIVWTDWRKRDSAATKPHQEYDIFIGAPGGRNRQVDPYGGRQVSTFWPSVCDGGGHALVAFQDSSAGRSAVRTVAMPGHRTHVLSGARSNEWRPRIACANGRFAAVWEDERDGPPR